MDPPPKAFLFVEDISCNSMCVNIIEVMQCVGNKCMVPEKASPQAFIKGKLAKDRASRGESSTIEQIKTLIQEADAKRLANPNVKFTGIGNLADQAKQHLAKLHLYVQAGAITAEQSKGLAPKLKAISLAV